MVVDRLHGVPDGRAHPLWVVRHGLVLHGWHGEVSPVQLPDKLLILDQARVVAGAANNGNACFIENAIMNLFSEDGSKLVCKWILILSRVWKNYFLLATYAAMAALSRSSGRGTW